MPNDTVSAAAKGLSNSRRAVLGAIVAASAVASVPAASSIASASAADPVFAAIERHEKARAALCKVCGLTDEATARNEGRQITEADEAIVQAADNAEELALLAVVGTMPQTTAGLNLRDRRFPILIGKVTDFVSTSNFKVDDGKEGPAQIDASASAVMFESGVAEDLSNGRQVCVRAKTTATGILQASRVTFDFKDDLVFLSA
jgi:hypothetical protein